MSKFHCTCVPEGQPSPHSDKSQCRANHVSTGAMLYRQNFPEPTPDVRDAQGQFVRFATDLECQLPHGTTLADGTLRRH